MGCRTFPAMMDYSKKSSQKQETLGESSFLMPRGEEGRIRRGKHENQSNHSVIKFKQ